MKTIYEKLEEIVGQSPEQKLYEISAHLYFELITEFKLTKSYLMKPQPPIKRIKTSRGFLFDSDEIEYDFHAPEYISALKKYEQEMQNIRYDDIYKKEYIEVFTSYGAVKFKISDAV